MSSSSEIPLQKQLGILTLEVRNKLKINDISVSGCGGMLNGSSGLFSTPGYPSKSYSNNMNCVWTLSIPTNGFVVIEFLKFDTEKG